MGPIKVAVSATAILGISVLSPRDAFVRDVSRRTGREPTAGLTPLLDLTIAAVEAFGRHGDPRPVQCGCPVQRERRQSARVGSGISGRHAGQDRDAPR